MSSPIPYLDAAGFTLRTVMRSGDVSLVTTKEPGYLEECIATRQEEINNRLQKRYVTPFGTSAPPIVATGTTPPAVTLSGTPAIGSYQIRIEITFAGAVGTALFRWSKDNGANWTSGVMTAASVSLPGTGLTANFASGNYATDNVYQAPTAVPRIVLAWLARMVTIDLYDKRGRDPQDPAMQTAQDRYQETLTQIKEAADAKDGLYDLPLNDQTAGSAVTQGGPLGYAEQSPYTWTDCQAAEGQLEDRSHGW